MAKEIIVYSQAGCSPCEKVKTLLASRGCPFIVKDVAKDAQAKAELEAMNYTTTPVTLIDGNVVVGFNIGQLLLHLEDVEQ